MLFLTELFLVNYVVVFGDNLVVVVSATFFVKADFFFTGGRQFCNGALSCLS